LSTSVDHDPNVSEQVDKLARDIAGPGATGEVQELARRIAQAQIDLHAFALRDTNSYQERRTGLIDAS
jgi:hypothetical protein